MSAEIVAHGDVEVLDGELVEAGLTIHDTPAVADWGTLREEFLATKSRSSSLTEQAYRRDLAQYEAFLTERLRVDPMDASRLALERWARHLVDQGLAPSTVRRKLAAVSGAYTFAVSIGALQINPAAVTERPQVADEPKTLTLSDRDVAALIAAAREHGTQALALVALLYFNGLRVTQVLSARVEDLAFDGDHRVLRVVQKRRKDRVTVPLRAAIARSAVEQLAEHRRTGPLFIVEPVPAHATARGWWTGSDDDQPREMTRGDVWRLVRKLCRHAGLPPVGPHALRHAFVTHALDAGVPIHEVQDHAQHRSINTTQRYNRKRRQHATHPGRCSKDACQATSSVSTDSEHGQIVVAVRPRRPHGPLD